MILCFSPKHLFYMSFSLPIFSGVTTLPAQTTHWILKGKSFKSTIHVPCLTPPRRIIHWPRLTPVFQGVYFLQLIQVNLGSKCWQLCWCFACMTASHRSCHAQDPYLLYDAQNACPPVWSKSMCGKKCDLYKHMTQNTNRSSNQWIRNRFHHLKSKINESSACGSFNLSNKFALPLLWTFNTFHSAPFHLQDSKRTLRSWEIYSAGDLPCK